LYAAEGSDWFWWFGEGHSSNQDAIFDRLFREHLCGIYKALNEPVPLIYTTSGSPRGKETTDRKGLFIRSLTDWAMSRTGTKLVAWKLVGRGNDARAALSASLG